MTMTPKEANELLKQEKISIGAVGEVEKILLREKLTPLQAQAVLTAAWNWILSQGRIGDVIH